MDLDLLYGRVGIPRDFLLRRGHKNMATNVDSGEFFVNFPMLGLIKKYRIWTSAVPYEKHKIGAYFCH